MTVNYTKGYKSFDKNLVCRGFQFEEGKEYFIEGIPVLCEKGFHFCEHIADTLQYYPNFEENVWAEVEALGEVVYENVVAKKACTNHIKIVRVLSREEILAIFDKNQNTGNYNTGNYNTGNYNTGNYNTGDCNTGDYNTGDCNTGYYNTGNYNTGSWNSVDMETGFFNTVSSQTVRVFNKDCSLADWDEAKKPSFLFFDIDPMLGYKGSFQMAFAGASAEDIALLKALPNFDADIFFELSGIRVD